jgi:transmembrane 9 superfamily protein 2/4
MKTVLFVVLALCFTSGVFGKVFYLPGVAPHDYPPNEDVALKVNKITSIHTQLPFKYYEFDLFCKPDVVEDKVENIGEILRGDRIESSLFDVCSKIANFAKIKAQKDDTCRKLCKKEYNADQVKQLSGFVADEYKVHW